MSLRYVDVTSYGAVLDGLGVSPTDNLVAVQAAISDAVADDKDLYVPGHCGIDGTLDFTGMGSRLVFGDGTKYADDHSSHGRSSFIALSNVPLISASWERDLRMSDIHLGHLDGSHTASLVELSNCPGAHIKRVSGGHMSIAAPRHYSCESVFKLTNCEIPRFERCYFDMAETFLTIATPPSPITNGVYIDGCVFGTASGPMIEYEGPGCSGVCLVSCSYNPTRALPIAYSSEVYADLGVVLKGNGICVLGGLFIASDASLAPNTWLDLQGRGHVWGPTFVGTSRTTAVGGSFFDGRIHFTVLGGAVPHALAGGSSFITYESS